MSEGGTARPGRLLAIGDVHGCDDELGELLAALAPGPGDKLVCLGDYVDRGEGSARVVDRLIRVREESGAETVFLKGNHEDMFLAWLGEAGRYGNAFLHNGGRATLASYGVDAADGPAAARAALPAEHLDFFGGLRLRDSDPPYLFVHAGISPLVPLEAQRDEDLLWIRDEFVANPHGLDATVVFGHTPQRRVLWDLPYKIGLDTGCVYGNRLSGIDFTTGSLVQVERGSLYVTSTDVRAPLESIEALRADARRS